MAACINCGNLVILARDDTGQRGLAWREQSWDDDRDYQCGLSDDGRHHPEAGTTRQYLVTVHGVGNITDKAENIHTILTSTDHILPRERVEVVAVTDR